MNEEEIERLIKAMDHLFHNKPSNQVSRLLCLALAHIYKTRFANIPDYSKEKFAASVKEGVLEAIDAENLFKPTNPELPADGLVIIPIRLTS